MEREKVLSKEVFKYEYPFDSLNKGWGYVKDTLMSSDLEKGISDYSMIVKRLSDNKFFMLEFSASNDSYEIEEFATEVFPKTIETVIYE